ncbi:MAG: 16S rRNA (cytidine(1402)-2'-O)-methyltransferase [Veillonella seminalis]|uniref:16S rRNA (cytidine(1402)-2'-O)-methyltransferase n=1 Tax=Veillonella seminalis TaxID=1502943 RepID=UPI0023F3F49A|nr:16S rRNA (cytidine(1402)-2'-O)-methyltransferase [Veillonella seminalis]MBS7079751.1 16S rRNA (cytidine(1402)-2'-O)-methyltransferase [Veillonella seminalis]
MSEPKGTLYLVPTPIGNLEDMTYRAVRVLQEVHTIAAEDTRHSGLLLKHFDIKKPLVSYHEHNKEAKEAPLMEILLSGHDVAVISDAGMPAISDPGADLVAAAIAEEIPVVPLPGPNAALTALIASGLDTREFTFLGFLPKKSSHRKELLERVATYQGTLLFYEAPHRLQASLQELYKYLGNRPIVVGRELTKKFETFVRTDLERLQKADDFVTIKGEFVLVVGGAVTMETEVTEDKILTTDDYVSAVTMLIEDGMAKKEAIREVAKRLGVARRDVYNAVEAAQDV